MKLKQKEYLDRDVVEFARFLLGKVLVLNEGTSLCSMVISETEAYRAFVDRASHAYAGRRSPRNEMMYARGGTSYVYLCYGIHPLFNVVINERDVPDAVLIRAGIPVNGIDLMEQRRGLRSTKRTFMDGPAKLTQAMGIGMQHNGVRLTGSSLYLEDRGYKFTDDEITAGPRIGVESAKEDALLPYRFRIAQINRAFT